MSEIETIYERVGPVAGRGRYPLIFCEEARRHEVRHLAVVAMHGETDHAIEKLADHVTWVHVGQIKRTLKVFHQQDTPNVVFAGQIKPGRLWDGLRPDCRALRLLAGLKRRNAESIFGAIANEFVKEGLTVLPATTFLQEYLATVGILGKRKPKRSVRDDIALGWEIAREMSRLDIGQTVIVKRGTVLAVEGFEGTDKAIRRGGELGRGGVTVVKTAKPNHDMRFDVPCIGMRTVEALQEARALALAVQAGKTLFLDRARVLRELDASDIAVVGLSADEPIE